ncbi:MAG: DUF2922 domain-containing protein [Xylanivirga thermophila]|uniref:DUF2922 domain-containing protein n=1 Tax=Xylanivirga thermophila TaxID=2496273 RepID=UPI00101C7185|nr:DUF2922 domain-containing protein [Xylanivirga thermophila]
MARVLEMVFKTGEGKNFRLTLNEPREDITSEEIKSAMDLIKAKNIFSTPGGIGEVVEANIIVTDVQPVELV